MKAFDIPPQQPPLTAPCPWCTGDLVVEGTVVSCATCEIQLPLALDPELAVAA
jgi:hypothetical protein